MTALGLDMDSQAIYVSRIHTDKPLSICYTEVVSHTSVCVLVSVANFLVEVIQLDFKTWPTTLFYCFTQYLNTLLAQKLLDYIGL